MVFHRNISASDTETKTIDWNLSSFSDLKLYKVNTKFENAGNVLTSYRDSTGKTYSITTWVSDVIKDAKTPPVDLYAQWTQARDKYILYIGDNTSLTPDGKDYVLQDGLSGKVKLKDEDTFQTSFPSSKIIGWSDRDSLYSSDAKKYYPGQEIELDSNLILFPLTGYNYVVYQFLQEGALVDEPEFYGTLSRASVPVGLLDVSFSALLHSHKADKVFYGWNAQQSGSGTWYTGLTKDAPHKLYAQMEDFPQDGASCILYSGLGFGPDYEKLGMTLPLKEGETVKLPEMPAECNGYTFKGWYLYAGGGDNDTKIEDGSALSKDNDKNIFYARWDKSDSSIPIKEYTVTFHSNGGKFSDGGTTTVLTVKDGEVVDKFPVATRDGWAFNGWFYKPDNLGIDDSPLFAPCSFTKDTILYAQWVDIRGDYDPPYNITFSAEGGRFPSGDTSLSLQTDRNGKIVNWPSNPVRSGYTFDFWYINTSGDPEVGNLQVNQHTIFPGHATVYAHWSPDSSKPSDKGHVIIIDGGGSITTDSDGKLTSLPTAPSKPGYIFDGWYTHPTGGDRVDTNYIFTGPITIYPHWRPNSTSTTYYRIYTPGRVYGGSYYVSHTTAAPGTRVTIELSPWSDYELDWLSVINWNTGWDLSLNERYWDEYTFIMPASDVEIELSYREQYVRNTSYVFYPTTQLQKEVGPYVWYYKDRHIYHMTDGLVPDNTPITRDMFLSVLYNLADNKGSTGAAFGSETNDAQTWATNENIVPDIYASGLWGLDKPLMREQAALLLYRYTGYRGYNLSQRADLTRYTDYNRIRTIARNGMSWAVASGLMTSTSATTLSPQSTLTCGQAGDLVFRFETNVIRVW